jgi:hypothetical protein
LKELKNNLMLYNKEKKEQKPKYIKLEREEKIK